jgi:hypothetical protein
MKTEISTYEQTAIDFAKEHNVKLSILGSDYRRHFQDDKQSRHVFKCKLTRNGKQYTFDFGQSIAAGDTEPTMYDVLTCLTKYDPETFEDFCSEFGYDEDSRKAEKIYNAVVREYKNVERLFGDILDKLQENV